jgi:hypothetical protein
MEHIHEILAAIVALYINSETAGNLGSQMLNHIGQFMEYVSLHLGDVAMLIQVQNTSQDT